MRALHPDLLTHLVDEFGSAGARAVEHLLSAEVLVAGGDFVLPASGSHVAFALRAALSALIETPDAPEGGQWRRTSRAVADAKVRYESVRSLPGDEAAPALQDLLERIDDMAQVHSQEALHQQRLIAIMLQRTGVMPISTGLEPVKAFDRLLMKLNRGVHKGATVTEGQEYWEACVLILEQLFLPPQVRNAELDALAAAPSPTPEEVDRALALLATPHHLHHFLGRARTPAWVEVLAEKGLLEPPAGPGGWPMFTAVTALRDTHIAALVSILSSMAERWKTDPARTWYVSRAALDLGEAGREIVLDAARRHRASTAMTIFVIDAASDSEAGDDFVARVADLVLNPVDLKTHAPYLDDFRDALVGGIDASNWDDRVRLLCRKLRRVPEGDLDRRMLFYGRASLSDERQFRDDEPFNALLGDLTRALGQAWQHADVTELLAVLNELPEDLRGYVRAWLLSEAPDVPREVLEAEAVSAVGERAPNGDDLRVVTRLMTLGPVDAYIPQWVRALGAPPDLGTVARGLADRELDPAWGRARDWSAVLPDEAMTGWTQVLAVLAGAFGPVSEARLRRATTEAAWGSSPMTLEELQQLPVLEAAAKVSEWRPDDADWLVSARELGRVVEKAAKADAAAWGTSPVQVAAALRHPTYIAHYLRGLASSSALAQVDVQAAVDVLELVAAHPWEVVPLGRGDGFDYDPDWSEAERAGIAFIKATAEAELSFGSKTNVAWRLALEACLDPTPSGISSSDDDGDLTKSVLERAISRPGTQALEALLALMGQEYREGGTVRPEGLAELDRVLALPGADGAEHRAVLAPRIGFLRYIAEQWTDEHLDVLYGLAAPTGLGDVTLLLTLRWSRPARWFLARFAARIVRAAAAGSDQALEHCVVGMLWAVQGLEPDTLVQFLAAAPDRLSAAGEDIGRLLRHNEPEPEFVERARSFWEAALASGSSDLGGFGWMAEVTALDDATWLALTLQTLKATRGVLDWSQEVAARAASCDASPVALDVLNLLVRGMTDPWQRRAVGEQAVLARSTAADLADTPEFRRLDSALRERGLL